jgi:hypothetical protein
MLRLATNVTEVTPPDLKTRDRHEWGSRCHHSSG